MRRTLELETRLKDWADVYGGDKYGNVGWHGKSSLHDVILYQGKAPQGLHPRNSKDRTPADDVNDAVFELERQKDGYRPARILRVEYFMRDAKEEHKLRALKTIGINVGRTSYYDALWVARVHVAAWLRIPNSVDLPEPAAAKK